MTSVNPSTPGKPGPRPHVACYYFPNYHQDARNAEHHGPGWTEWELVTRAEPRFPGHRQPRVPLHGMDDEADPAVFGRKIDLAADHGIDTFLFDWYYYNDGPFLQRALDEGFLGAGNKDRMTFALMWANHDWVDIHPAKANCDPPVLYPGIITPDTFERMTDHIIADYFLQPNYWCPGGKPYFSVYDVGRLLKSFGGIAPTVGAIGRFREKVRSAGFDDIHFNLVMWGAFPVLPGEKQADNPRALVDALGADSVASYVWIHHVPLKDFPAASYRRLKEESIAYWSKAESTYRKPYYPNVTVGWDASPRTVQSDQFENRGYPWMPTLNDANPRDFAEAMKRCVEFLRNRPAHEQVLSINAWNEWTEGSYLEPDTEFGTGYLEAIRDAVGLATQTSDNAAALATGRIPR